MTTDSKVRRYILSFKIEPILFLPDKIRQRQIAVYLKCLGRKAVEPGRDPYSVSVANRDIIEGEESKGARSRGSNYALGIRN